MERDVLQIFASTYVIENDNVTLDNKLKIIEFLKTADEYEILNLLKTGNIGKVQEQERDSLVEEYNQSYIGTFLNEAKVKVGLTGASPSQYWKQFYGQKLNVPTSNTTKAVGAAVVVALIVTGAYQVYKHYMSKAARSCKGSDNKKACMAKFKSDAVKAQIKAMNSKMGACAKSKNPEKCRKSVTNKIAKLKSKI
jgi:hypothetical protein